MFSITCSSFVLPFNFALSRAIFCPTKREKTLVFCACVLFFAVLAHCGRFYGVLAIILYIYTCYALYRVIRLCVRFDCDVQFSGHNRFGFGAVGVFLPPFFYFLRFLRFLFSAFSAFSVHKNFLHLNTA